MFSVTKCSLALQFVSFHLVSWILSAIVQRCSAWQPVQQMVVFSSSSSTIVIMNIDWLTISSAICINLVDAILIINSQKFKIPVVCIVTNTVCCEIRNSQFNKVVYKYHEMMKIILRKFQIAMSLRIQLIHILCNWRIAHAKFFCAYRSLLIRRNIDFWPAFIAWSLYKWPFFRLLKWMYFMLFVSLTQDTSVYCCIWYQLVS